MEIKQLEWPRLSGSLLYGEPKPWMVVENENGIEIIPAETPRGLIVALVAIGLVIVVVVQLLLPWVRHNSDKIWATVGSAGVLITFIVGAIFFKVKFNREQARGPILLISFATRQLTLPRVSKMWSFSQVVRWDILYGMQIRDQFGRSRRFVSSILELQVVVKNGECQLSAWPIAGALAKNDAALHDVGQRIAARMNLPLVFVTAKGSRVL
jgi:hypothetical protein